MCDEYCDTKHEDKFLVNEAENFLIDNTENEEISDLEAYYLQYLQNKSFEEESKVPEEYWNHDKHRLKFLLGIDIIK